MAEARGDFISLLDDDDEYLPSFIEATWRRFSQTDAQEAIGWCGHHIVSWKPPGIVEHEAIREYPACYPTRLCLIEQFLCIGTGFGITMKRSLVDAIGNFDTRLRTAEDTDFFIRVVNAGFSSVTVPGVHLIQHNHSGPKLTSAATVASTLSECEGLLERHAAFFSRFPTCRERLLRHIQNLRSGVDSRELFHLSRYDS